MKTITLFNRGYHGWGNATKCLVATGIMLFWFWLAATASCGIGGSIPTGTEPTITHDAIVSSLAAGKAIEGQVIWGLSLNAAIQEAARSRPDTPITIKLENCRVVGDAFLQPGMVECLLQLNNVHFDSYVSITLGDAAFLIRLEYVEFDDRLYLVLNRGQSTKAPTATGQTKTLSAILDENGHDGTLLFNRVKIRGTLHISGGDKRVDLIFDHLTVGEDMSVTGFRPRSGEISLAHSKIGTDLIFKSNGMIQNAVTDRKGLQTLSKEPSLLKVNFDDVDLAGDLIFQRSNLALLDGNGNGQLQATKCSGRAYFQGCHMKSARLTRMDFRDTALFSHCSFDELRLDEAVFRKDVTFDETILGGPSPAKASPSSVTGGMSMDGVIFAGKLGLDWENVSKSEVSWFSLVAPPTVLVSRPTGGATSTAWSPPSAQTWKNLHEAWTISGNGQAANEADFRYKLVRLASHPGGGKWSDMISLWVWGFGYRPIRPLLWIGVMVMGFAVLYCMQVPRWTHNVELKLTDDKLQLENICRKRGLWSRFGAACSFSFQVGWKWAYGWEHTRGWFWTGLALAEQCGVKVLLLLFAKSLANTSPLLKEITDKLLPFAS